MQKPLTVQEEGSSLSTAGSNIKLCRFWCNSWYRCNKNNYNTGGGGDVFKNIAMPDGSTVVAGDSATDTLTLAQSGLVSITGNSNRYSNNWNSEYGTSTFKGRRFKFRY